ncbi:MAG: hypothetical protein K6B52_09790 [Clostridiales bacterium]|nr:hypothetical protein [Clostridiales bacterium]
MNNKLKRSVWIIFGIGFIAYIFSAGRWNIAFTAWIWPFAFLYYSRQSKTKRRFLLLVAALAIGHVIKWLNVMDGGYILDAVFCLLWSYCWVLPFLADRLVAKKLPGSILSSLIFPAVFVSIECLRSLTPLGSIGAIAYSQSGFLPLVQVTSLIGSFGLSFLICWFGAVAVNVTEKRQGSKTIAVVCFSALLISIGFGCVRLAAFPVDTENTARVASVVGPYYKKQKDGTYDEITAEESLHYFLSEAQRAADGGAKIACWNEEAFALKETEEHLILDAATEFAKANGMILIIGYELSDSDGSENGDSINKSILVETNGTVTEYVKTHLIPFIELPGYVKGEGAVPSVATNYGIISCIICFDDTFMGFVRENTVSTDILFVPSWDWEPIKHTHTDISEFRAVENGFTLVKPTYDGISTAVNRLGYGIKRFDTAGVGFDTVQFADIPTRAVPTLYSRIGDAVDTVLFLSGFVTLALGAVQLHNKRSKQSVTY